MVAAITSKQEFTDALSHDGLVVVDFSLHGVDHVR